MDGHKPLVVTLPDRWPHAHHPIGTLLLPTPPFLHVDDHLLERIGFLFDLASANGWQQEPRILVDVRLSSVNLAARLACKVFLRLSILHSLRAHHSSMNDHVLVDVTLAHVSD